MIDLHSHILPGLDDGAPDLAASLEMARRAADEGVRTMVATPHVNYEWDYPLAHIGERVGALNRALASAELPLVVLSGGEIALSRLAELDDDSLRWLRLGGGPFLLVESPYARAVRSMDELLSGVQARGFGVLLAHPERCPIFHNDPGRLDRLVERGVLCALNAGSLAGSFGATARAFALELLHRGMAHAVASDAHDCAGRPPGLRLGLARAEAEVPDLARCRDWLTREAPVAILTGRPLPPQPLPRRPAPSRWRRLIGRS